MRRCTVCGASLEGRRRHARTCSASCRREAARLRAILAGAEPCGYSTLAGSGIKRAVETVQNRPNGRYDGSTQTVGPRCLRTRPRGTERMHSRRVSQATTGSAASSPEPDLGASNDRRNDGTQ